MTSALTLTDNLPVPRGVYRGGWSGNTVEFEWGDGSRTAQSQECGPEKQWDEHCIPCWVCSDGVNAYVTDDPAEIKR